jgi:hypothetical protein
MPTNHKHSRQTARVVSLTMIPYNGNPYSTIWGVTADTTQGVDGDGAVIKKVTAETTYDNANGDETTTNTTYLISSSVLGGKVVTEAVHSSIESEHHNATSS